MQYAPALPPNFRMSKEASRRIRDWVEFMNKEKGLEFIPALFIIRDIDKYSNKNPRPAVGLYNFDDVDEKDIFTINELRFVFPVTKDDYDLFNGKTLEHKNGQYLIS